MTTQQDLDVRISVHGDVQGTDRDRAIDKIGRLVDYVREPVLMADVKLVVGTNPANERPAEAEASLDINGTPIRAHVAAGDLEEAIDLLVDRLKRRIRRHEERLHRTGKGRHGTESPDGEWRHGDLRSHRPQWFDRPSEDRELIRHKTFALEPLTLDEAGFDLDALAHDFYLFTEISTMADTLASWDLDHGLWIQQLEDSPPLSANGTAVPFRVGPPAPELSHADAVQRLEDGGERFVFFRDADAERGHVLYHRYDGHYGLITPAT